MSPTGVNHLPIEYISLDLTLPLGLIILGLFQFFLNIILDWDTKIYSFFLDSNKSSSSSCSAEDGKVHLKNSVQVKGREQSTNKGTMISKNNENFSDESIMIYREEVEEVVMKSLGLFCNPESEKLQEKFDANDFSNMFEENEPSLQELKETFDVFDENKDGFIDALELQKLLCSLGFIKEGSELDNCKKMIRVFDLNGDERIDFQEFLKFMESSLC